MISYLVPAEYGEAEFVEKRSRFIGRVWRVDTEEQALERLHQTREKHRDATHNVYAYIIRDNNITRHSDDGEPSGTSGLPTLNVFTMGDITNVCCVVTRYFGGTLLGTGGLVRAYAKAARLALDAAGVARMAEWRELLLFCDYPFYERAQRLLGEYEALIKNTDYGTDVVIRALIRADRADSFALKLTDCSNGTAVSKSLGTSFLGVQVN